jgi:hypothetical protein
MKAVLLMLTLVATARPALAGESQITCDTVRAYVTQVGLVRAKADARAAGMTVAQQRRARQCLADKN